MKKIKSFLIKVFHLFNLMLIIFYLYPGSILGYLLYNDLRIQPEITGYLLFSSNHFYAFIVLSILGVLAYNNTKSISFLTNYLFLLSIILELFHTIIPNRNFEWRDLFGNILGVFLIFIIFKFYELYKKIV